MEVKPIDAQQFFGRYSASSCPLRLTSSSLLAVGPLFPQGWNHFDTTEDWKGQGLQLFVDQSSERRRDFRIFVSCPFNLMRFAQCDRAKAFSRKTRNITDVQGFQWAKSKSFRFQLLLPPLIGYSPQTNKQPSFYLRMLEVGTTRLTFSLMVLEG